jgi:hypothetical protein
MAKVFQKRLWRRRMLIRLCIIPGMMLLIFGGIALWVARSLPGIAVREISRLTNTRIEMGPLNFHRNASVEIDGLVIRPPQPQFFYDTTILRVKKVYAKFSWVSLFLLSPRVREIHMRDFILDVQYDLDSRSWNVSDLRFMGAPKSGAGGIPTVYLRNGKLRYSKVSGGESDLVTSLPIEADLGPSDLPGGGYAFDIRTSALSGGYGDSSLRGTWRPGSLTLAGGLSSTDIPSLERAWAVDVLAADATYDDSGKYQLSLRLKNVHGKHSPEADSLRAAAPQILGSANPLAMVQDFFSRFQPCGLVSRIEMTAKGNLHAIEASEVSGIVDCEDVSICDRKFPYPVDHLNGLIMFTQAQINLNRLSGTHGETNLVIQGSTSGSGDDLRYDYRVASDNMVLDEELYAALASGPRQMWDAFMPRGVVGVNYEQRRTGPTQMTSLLNVDLRGVSATYKQFPYPLSGLTGRLRFDHDNIDVLDVTAPSAGGRILLNGRVRAAETETPVYDIRVDANGVALDKNLGEALPPVQRDLYRLFDSVGTVDIRGRVFTAVDGNTVGGASFFADTTLKDAALRIEGLPEPISGISAKATLTPDSLSVTTADGRYGESPVSLAGGVRFTRDGKPRQYNLKIAAQQMPLGGKVLSMLPESIQPCVASLHAEGKADIAVEFAKMDGNAPPDYRMTVKCLGDTIKYDRFPYPLSDIRGTVTVDRNALTFSEIKARPALQPEPDLNPVIQIDGTLPLTGPDACAGTLTVYAKDLLFNAALGEAMPKAWAGVYRDLAPRGPFDLDWRASQIVRDGNDGSRISFDGQVALRTCSLDLSGAGAELAGTLALKGTYDSAKGLTDGSLRLAADRLTVKDKDFTQVRADVVYDPNSGVWTAENFLGDCYDGRVLGDLSVAPSRPGVMQYLLTIAFSQVNLEPFLLGRRTAQAPGNASENGGATVGTMNAALSLGAQVGDGSSRLGACKIHVVDMQIGKVSPLSKLLAFLSLTEPTDYAFERMLVESYLRRNKLLIHKFDLAGKSVAFTGSGSMDLLSNNVNLTLTARGKRLAESPPSVIQSLTEGLGGGVVRMEVTGKADNPQIQTKTLPVIEESLKILGTSKK